MRYFSAAEHNLQNAYRALVASHTRGRTASRRPCEQRDTKSRCGVQCTYVLYYIILYVLYIPVIPKRGGGAGRKRYRRVYNNIIISSRIVVYTDSHSYAHTDTRNGGCLTCSRHHHPPIILLRYLRGNSLTGWLRVRVVSYMIYVHNVCIIPIYTPMVAKFPTVCSMFIPTHTHTYYYTIYTRV